MSPSPSCKSKTNLIRFSVGNRALWGTSVHRWALCFGSLARPPCSPGIWCTPSSSFDTLSPPRGSSAAAFPVSSPGPRPRCPICYRSEPQLQKNVENVVKFFFGWILLENTWYKEFLALRILHNSTTGRGVRHR